MDTLGCPKDLSFDEQVAWARLSAHPQQKETWQVPQAAKDAVAFEAKSDLQDLDASREQLMRKWLHTANQFRSEHLALLKDAGFEKCSLRQKLNIPFVDWLSSQLPEADMELPLDLLRGFPLVGKLPPCKLEALPDPKPQQSQPVEKLLGMRAASNEKIVNSLRTSEFSNDLLDIHAKDAQLGAISDTVVVTESFLEQVNVSRRIPVREQRNGTWRTRAVDDMTESWVNTCTEQSDRQCNGTLLHLIYFLLMLSQLGASPCMWKRDIKSAFRRLPILACHSVFAWVVWLSNGVAVAARHDGMPFGAVSSVVAWHRFGAFLSAVLLHICRSPVSRYVDDFFGASPHGLYWSGGRMLGVLTTLCGVLCDESKDEDQVVQMIVLGMTVEWCRSFEHVRVSLEQSKALQWLECMLKALQEEELAEELAAKMAGRLQWCLSASRSRAGRSYLKALFAQANKPLPFGAMSSRLKAACRWICDYLRLRPASVYKTLNETRDHTISWSDASGEDRWLAVVLLVDGRFWWTRCQVQQKLIDIFLPREDSYIGLLELLAPLLAWATFGAELRNKLWTAYIDNQGVLHNLLKGTAASEEANYLVGRLWLELAEAETHIFVQRVESKSNIADGPTRASTDYIKKLNAMWRAPVLPAWIEDIWR